MTVALDKKVADFTAASTGGDVQFVETSAVTGQGISDLLDTIVLVAEVEELTADPDRRAAGTCLGCAVPGSGGVPQRVCREGPVFAADELAWEAVP